MIGFPFQIVAAGNLPYNATVGEVAPNTSMCTATKQNDPGAWQILADDATLGYGNSVLIVFPGSGSNVLGLDGGGGVSFGQAQQLGNLFAFGTYRNVPAVPGEEEDPDPPGQPFDCNLSFIIVRFPPSSADEGGG